MNNNKPIYILQLYPNDMNIYGDYGNTLTLKKRAECYGYQPVIINYNIGDAFPVDVDIILGGGGQDSGQIKIQSDLHKIAPKLEYLAQNDTPMLMICGMYQLFGHFFKTSNNKLIPGISLLNIETYASDDRMIGNIIINSQEFGEIIGYENHSGKTYLKENASPLGTVLKGCGNNGDDQTEGARYRNIIGSYIHGSLLPKNPKIADFLLKSAITKRYGEFKPTDKFDDSLSELARQSAKKRPR